MEKGMIVELVGRMDGKGGGKLGRRSGDGDVDFVGDVCSPGKVSLRISFVLVHYFVSVRSLSRNAFYPSHAMLSIPLPLGFGAPLGG